MKSRYSILHEIEQRGDYEVWGFADDGYADTVRISRSGCRFQMVSGVE